MTGLTGLTEDEVAQRIACMTCATSYPILTPAELAYLLEEAKIADADGYTPEDTNWTATYNIQRSIVLGWTIKMGKAASGYDFTDMGQTFHRNQVFNNCKLMRNMFYGNSTIQVNSDLVQRYNINETYLISGYIDNDC